MTLCIVLRRSRAAADVFAASVDVRHSSARRCSAQVLRSQHSRLVEGFFYRSLLCIALQSVCVALKIDVGRVRNSLSSCSCCGNRLAVVFSCCCCISICVSILLTSSFLASVVCLCVQLRLLSSCSSAATSINLGLNSSCRVINPRRPTKSLHLSFVPDLLKTHSSPYLTTSSQKLLSLFWKTYALK